MASNERKTLSATPRPERHEELKTDLLQFIGCPPTSHGTEHRDSGRRPGLDPLGKNKKEKISKYQLSSHVSFNSLYRLSIINIPAFPIVTL